MPAKDPRVDAYFAKSADFARPVLTRLRAIVRATCPDAEERLRWSVPHFTYRGKLLCSLAAFKPHAASRARGPKDSPCGPLPSEGVANGSARGFAGDDHPRQVPAADESRADVRQQAEAIESKCRVVGIDQNVIEEAVDRLLHLQQGG